MDTNEETRKRRQDYFDRGARGVIAQGRPSVGDNGDCVYRGPDGCRCVVGWLIPDERYETRLDDGDFSAKNPAVVQAVGAPLEDVGFLRDMQYAHDEAAESKNFVADFVASMRGLADEYGLDASVLGANNGGA